MSVPSLDQIHDWKVIHEDINELLKGAPEERLVAVAGRALLVLEEFQKVVGFNGKYDYPYLFNLQRALECIASSDKKTMVWVGGGGCW